MALSRDHASRRSETPVSREERKGNASERTMVLESGPGGGETITDEQEKIRGDEKKKLQILYRWDSRWWICDEEGVVHFLRRTEIKPVPYLPQEKGESEEIKP